MDIPFYQVEWSNAVKCSPSKLELQATVREFSHCTIEPQNTRCNILDERGDKRGWLAFDEEDTTDIQRLKCVVVGRARARKGQERGEQEHYILAVMQRLRWRWLGFGHFQHARNGCVSIEYRYSHISGL